MAVSIYRLIFGYNNDAMTLRDPVTYYTSDQKRDFLGGDPASAPASLFADVTLLSASQQSEHNEKYDYYVPK